MTLKLVFHSPAHRKNTTAIEQMCKAYNIQLEFTNSFDRIREDNYDILIMNQHYVDASLIPSKIKIIYGPQLFVFAEGNFVGPLDPLLCERAVINVLSSWNTIRLLEDKPLRAPIVEFPFSVDLEKFKPIAKKSTYTYDCLVYFKNRKRELLETTLETLKEKGLKYKEIVYGSYSEDSYIQMLHSTKCMIVIDAHESQGFALEEAMACDVPLLVLDARSMYDECPDGVHSTYESKKPLPLRATSVPYWSDECGIRILSTKNLSGSIDKIMATHSFFSPRKYIERELSPEKCMRRILEYFDLLE